MKDWNKSETICHQHYSDPNIGTTEQLQLQYLPDRSVRACVKVSRVHRLHLIVIHEAFNRRSTIAVNSSLGPVNNSHRPLEQLVPSICTYLRWSTRQFERVSGLRLFRSPPTCDTGIWEHWHRNRSQGPNRSLLDTRIPVLGAEPAPHRHHWWYSL